MFNLILFLYFCLMAYRIAVGVRGNLAVLAEFRQAPTLGWLALLFPLGPVLGTLGAPHLGFEPAALAMLGCYLPALLVAHGQGCVLDTAGTDRAQPLEKVTAQAFGAALVGLIYGAIWLAFIVVPVFMQPEA